MAKSWFLQEYVTKSKFYAGICGKILILQEYVKFELPPNQPITVSIGVDVKDIPKVNKKKHSQGFIKTLKNQPILPGNWWDLEFQVSDKDFSITLNAYFIVKWYDSRCVLKKALNVNQVDNDKWLWHKSTDLKIKISITLWFCLFPKNNIILAVKNFFNMSD